MTALVLRNLEPQQYEPARTAQQIVAWYAVRPYGLWVLLIALPLAVLVIGTATLVRCWNEDAQLRLEARQTFAVLRSHLTTLLVALATLAAAGTLAIVALKVLRD